MEFGKQTGTVVWFNPRKGFGFIKSDDPMDTWDIFVHWKGLIMEGYKQLKDGDRVEYALQDSARGIIAVDVLILAAPK